MKRVKQEPAKVAEIREMVKLLEEIGEDNAVIRRVVWHVANQMGLRDPEKGGAEEPIDSDLGEITSVDLFFTEWKSGKIGVPFVSCFAADLYKAYCLFVSAKMTAAPVSQTMFGLGMRRKMDKIHTPKGNVYYAAPFVAEQAELFAAGFRSALDILESMRKPCPEKGRSGLKVNMEELAARAYAGREVDES